MTASASSKGKLTGWHVAMIIGGLFAVVLTMNITFITLALRSFAGDDVEDAYTRGVAYNDVLADRAAQRDLGWSLGVETNILADQVVEIRLQLTDRNDLAVTGATITALLRRPTNEGVDQTFNLSTSGDGIYVGRATLALAGVWDLHLDASTPDGSHLEFEERLWVE